MDPASLDPLLAGAFEDAPLGLALSDAAGRFLEVNPALCEILARSDQELREMDYAEVLHPEDHPTEAARLAELLDGRISRYRVEERYVRPDGQIRWVTVTASRATDGAAQPPAVVRRVVDVTERKKTEGLLRQREAQLAEAQQLAHLGSWEWDVPGDRWAWSVELYRIFGLEPEELPATGEAFLERAHPDDREFVRQVVEWSLSEGTPFTFEFRIVRPDGSERMVHARGRVVADPQGTPVRMAGTVQDVTEWRGAEAALRQSEERFRRVFEEGPMGIAIVDPDLRFIRVNAAFGEMLGYSAGELRGQTLAEVTHPDDVDLDVAMARRAFAGEIPGYEIEKRFTRQDGDVIWGRVRVSVVRGEGGEPLYGLWLIEDISEAKEADAARWELDALKDGFLRVVSHDLQNPLVTIAGLADLLAGAREGPGGEQQRLLGQIGAHAERLRRMVTTFLDVDRLYQGGARAFRRPTDVAGLARRVVEGLDGRGHPISVEAPPLVAAVDPDQVEHIVENLLDNALSHTPPGTPVWLRIEDESGAVAVVVEDAGPGVPDGLKEAVFELFRTGDPKARRTGIGLWVVARFAQLHGGRAWVEDRPGGGASFRALLLTADEPDRDPAS